MARMVSTIPDILGLPNRHLREAASGREGPKRGVLREAEAQASVTIFDRDRAERIDQGLSRGGTPAIRKKEQIPMPAPVVAVLNMKGGVGKTTISAHMPREIFSHKMKSVLLVDLDPQYNLTQQLLDPTRYDTAVADGRISLRMFEPAPVSDFFDINVKGDEPPEAQAVAVPLRHFTQSPEITLSLVPGTFELTKYSFISDQTKLGHAREYFKRAISKARSKFDLVVLDMNPSSSFLTFCGLSVATDILSPVRPDKFSVLGLELVKKLIDHPSVGGKPNLHIVMNGVKRSQGITQTEADIRSAPFFKDRLLANRVYQSGVLTARSDYTGFIQERKVSRKKEVSSDLRKVAFELCGRIGL